MLLVISIMQSGNGFINLNTRISEFPQKLLFFQWLKFSQLLTKIKWREKYSSFLKKYTPRWILCHLKYIFFFFRFLSLLNFILLTPFILNILRNREVFLCQAHHILQQTRKTFRRMLYLDEYFKLFLFRNKLFPLKKCET